MSELFYERYSSVYEILFKNYRSLAKNVKVENLEKDLTSLAFSQMCREFDEYEDEIGDLMETDMISVTEANEVLCETYKDSDTMKVFKFLVLTGLSAYFGLSNIDFKLVSERKFGFTGVFDTIEGMFVILNKDTSTFKSDIFTKLLSVCRPCDSADYFSNGLYNEDMEFVEMLMTKVETKVSNTEEETRAIIDALGGVLDSEVSTIVNVYKDILSANFGIDPYVGVFTFDNTKPVVGLNERHCVKEVEPRKEFRDYYMSALADSFDFFLPSCSFAEDNFSVLTERQFDYEAIYAGYDRNKNCPVYFPYKVLEIITKSEFTYNIQTLAYKECKNSDCINISAYMKYLKSKFFEDIFGFCSVICHRFLDSYNLDASMDGDTDELTLEQMLDRGLGLPATEKFLAGVRDILAYYTRCATTCVILTSLDTDVETTMGVSITSIIQYRIKMSCANSLPNNLLFNKRISSLKYNNSTRLDDCEEINPHRVDNCYISDFAYTFDSDKVYARPVFAYKALEILQQQQQTVDWSHILLGRYADGSICKTGTNEKIDLQLKKVHNIYAGSRSGKGVMCYNIFATAIASGIPIFYLDRKPDTSVILKDLASNIFAVNGGQYDSTIDVSSKFTPDKINYRVPSYMENVFSDNTIKGDYMYFRAMLLMFSLIVFADSSVCSNDENYKKIISMLGNGAVFVLDEFTNFTEQFLAKYPIVGEWFRGENCYSQHAINSWSGTITGIKEAQLNLNAKKTEEQKIIAKDKLDNKIEETNFNLKGLYMAELADDYRAVVDAIPELLKSGGGFSKIVQIFIIGQDIPSKYYDGNKWFNLSNGSNRAKFRMSEHKNSNGVAQDVPMIKMINDIGGDYILGYQPDTAGGKPDYLAQLEEGTVSSSMLTASRRCFCYHNPAGNLTFSGTQRLTNTKAAFGDRRQEMNKFLEEEFTYFKPFLILNNAVVPPEELLHGEGVDGLAVSDKLALMRQAKGYPQYKDSQYVGQCLTSCNKAGLTWEDFIHDNADSSGSLNKGVGFEGYIKNLCGTVPSEQMSKSGDIMNIFVKDIFGYKDGDWLDFLADFRPEALFKPSDFVEAVLSKETYSAKTRLRNSFFAPALLKKANDTSFASIFSEQLGTLLPLYDDFSQGSPDLSLARYKSFNTGISDNEFGTSDDKTPDYYEEDEEMGGYTGQDEHLETQQVQPTVEQALSMGVTPFSENRVSARYSTKENTATKVELINDIVNFMQEIVSTNEKWQSIFTERVICDMATSIATAYMKSKEGK